MRPTTRSADGNAEADLDRLVRQMEREDRISYATAYHRVLLANPRLYQAYLEQHQRQTGGAQG